MTLDLADRSEKIDEYEHRSRLRDEGDVFQDTNISYTRNYAFQIVASLNVLWGQRWDVRSALYPGAA